MISEKKLIANRQNAKLGGVKTEAGKAVVRLNAVSHGLLSKEVILQGEDARLLNSLRENFMNEYQPANEIETILVERIVSSLWRLKRLLRVEKNYITEQLVYEMERHEYQQPQATSWHGMANVNQVPVWQNLNRYETTIERQMYKALHELERLQRMRKGEYTPAPVAVDVEVSNNE